MPFYKFLVDDPNSVLLNIPSGKTTFSNPGVYFKQSAQKGETCWFYSLRLIQPRIGKDHNLQSLPERILEKQSSNVRKQITLSEINYDQAKAIIKKLEEDEPEIVFDRKTIEGLKAILTELVDVDLLETTEESKAELQLYNDFLSQNIYEDLKTFVKCRHLKNQIKIFKDFLENFNFNLEEKISGSEFPGKINVSELLNSNDIKHLKDLVKILSDITLETLCNGYGVKIAKWVPSDNIEKLIQVIKEKGPLVVIGDVGTPFGKRMEDIGNFENYKIKNWEPVSRLFESRTHCVVIIGASKTANENYIYFIDPNDESIPNQPRTIYQSTYHDFCKSLRNLYGEKVNNNLYLNQGKYDFAYYGNIDRLNEFRIMNEILVDVSVEETQTNIVSEGELSEEESLDEFAENLEIFLENKNVDQDKTEEIDEPPSQAYKKVRYK